MRTEIIYFIYKKVSSPVFVCQEYHCFSPSMIFLLDFGIVPTLWYFYCVWYYLHVRDNPLNDIEYLHGKIAILE